MYACALSCSLPGRKSHPSESRPSEPTLALISTLRILTNTLHRRAYNGSYRPQHDNRRCQPHRRVARGPGNPRMATLRRCLEGPPPQQQESLGSAPQPNPLPTHGGRRSALGRLLPRHREPCAIGQVDGGGGVRGTGSPDQLRGHDQR